MYRYGNTKKECGVINHRFEYNKGSHVLSAIDIQDLRIEHTVVFVYRNIVLVVFRN